MEEKIQWACFHVPVNAADENTKEATTKLIEILNFAKEHNALVEFCFS